MARVAPGIVVRIDPGHLGEIGISREAYNRRVAGVTSGAGSVKPGMLMGQVGSVANGAYPVALTGRVYVWCDASGAIAADDQLSTSDVPGHAMKVTDHAAAQCAIVGNR